MNIEQKQIFLKNLQELQPENVPKILELSWNFEEILLILQYLKKLIVVDKLPAATKSGFGLDTGNRLSVSSAKRDFGYSHNRTPSNYLKQGLQDPKYFQSCCQKAINQIVEHFKLPSIYSNLDFIERILKEIDLEFIKDIKVVDLDLVTKRIYQEYRNLLLNNGSFAMGIKDQAETLKRIGQRLSTLFQTPDLFSQQLKQVPKIDLEPTMQNNILTKRGREMIQLGLCKSNKDSLQPNLQESFLEEWWGWEYLYNHFGFLIILSTVLLILAINY